MRTYHIRDLRWFWFQTLDIRYWPLINSNKSMRTRRVFGNEEKTLRSGSIPFTSADVLIIL